MDYLTQLPDELLLSLSEFFLYHDLSAISLTCRRLNQIVFERLQLHKSLKRKFTTVDDTQWSSTDLQLGWFDVLARLLKSSFPPEYVNNLRITHCPWYWNELSTLAHWDSRSTSKPWREDDMNVVVRAALSSPWIYRDGSIPCGGRSAALNMSDFVREIKEGDMDNILAILMPSLPYLTSLELAPGQSHSLEDDQPSTDAWMGSVPGIVKRIASSALDPSRKHELLRIQNPAPYHAFQNLRYLLYDFTAIGHMPWAATLNEIAPWMSLPSLRRVDIREVVADHTFRWPDDSPKSKVQDLRIYAAYGHRLPLQSAVELAKGCQWPCLITHRDLSGHEYRPHEGEYDWQAVRVGHDGDIQTLGGLLPS